MTQRRLSGGAGLVFHVMNRGIRRNRLFDGPDDYDEFVDLMRQAHERVPIRLLSYCLMPNHFHFAVWPSSDGEMPRFMHWLTSTHSKRWHVRHETTGLGSVYQGRFKALPVQTEAYFFRLCRYIERNPLRAELVLQAEDWRWSSLHQRCRSSNVFPLAEWPLLQPPDWLDLVNGREQAADLREVRAAVRRSRPLGDPPWIEATAHRLGLSGVLTAGGRPKQKPTPRVGFSVNRLF
jgi:putative transposase